MDPRLLDLLVCPICKGPLDYDRTTPGLVCPRDRLIFPIRDGIPVMLVEQALDMDPNLDVDNGDAGPARDTHS